MSTIAAAEQSFRKRRRRKKEEEKNGGRGGGEKLVSNTSHLDGSRRGSHYSTEDLAELAEICTY